MKNYIHKILAGIIAVAMVFGNFAGLGVAEVKAASVYTEISIYVEDEDMEVVEGIYLNLRNTSGGKDIRFGPTEEFTGKATYKITGNDVGEYVVEPAKDSGYVVIDEELKIKITESSIEIVGSQRGEGVLTVKGGADKSEIDTVISSPTEISWEGGTVKITVTGTALPDALFYQVLYTRKEGEGVVVEEKTIKVGGTSDSKTFNVALPAFEKYPNALTWKINVALSEGDYMTSTRDIAIKKDTVTEETKTALNAAINEMKNLTESDYTVKSWNTYKTSIDAASALLTKQDATNTECQAAIQAIKKAKEGLVLKSDTASQETKNALQAAVNGTVGINEADYTSTSWKAFSTAVANAKSLLKDEDATEVQCKAAIEEIERTKAALVIAKINVSKLTITGASKKLAAGKKVKLTAKVSPTNATNQSVKWTSSNKKYATVDSKGNVTLKKAGAGKNVTITATAADGSKVKATYKIKIMKSSVKSISLKAKKSVKAGKSLKVKAAVKTTGKSANKTLKWTSSNTKYATVSAKGVVKAKKAGKGKKVKITATATDGSKKKKTVTIKIK